MSGIKSEIVTIPTKDGGSFSAYMALPETLPAPSVVVIQEIFGVNEGMKAKCHWLAEQGFIAICPDLFWRLEPGIALTDQTEEEWQQAFDLYNRFNVDLGIEDIRATEHVMKGHAYGNHKVGAMGYCLGGKLAYLTAARTNIHCAVGYYGVGLDELLDEAANIKTPLMLHIAEEDEYVSKDAQEVIKNSLKDNDLVATHSYAGVNHAFSRHNGQNYNAEAAELADNRTIAFLRDNLG